MNVVLVIERERERERERGALLLWDQIITRDEGAKRSHPKWEWLWKNTLKEKYLRVAVNLRTTEALMKKEIQPRKGDQKSRTNDIDLEARKTKRKSIGDIHLRHHHQAYLMTILMRVNIEIMRARKAQIPDLGSFLRRISRNTEYLQIWPNTPTLILIPISKRQTK